MVNLTIYRFSLLNKAKQQQVLNFYNEEEDLLQTMNDFCTYVHTNIRDYIDAQGKYRTFTLADKQKMDGEQRLVMGYFDSAYTGEKSKVKDRISNKLKFDIEKRDLVSKDFFFMIHIPKGSKFGFLIVEKKENHSVKTIFSNAFNNFMRAKGVSDYFLELKQAPTRYLIQNFLKHGSLKEFRLVDSQLQSDIALFDQSFGKEERVIKLTNPQAQTTIKKALISIFEANSEKSDRVTFLTLGDFDEVIFVLSYNGVNKTFYIKERDKIRANVDVTNLVEFVNGEASFDSLVRISLDLIKLVA